MATRPRGTTSREWQGFRTVAWALTLAGTLASQASVPRAQTDQTPPTVVARTPAVGAAGVSVQTAVAVVFDEPVQPATVVVELRNASNQLIAAQLTYDAPTLTATLVPNAALVGSQQYTATARSARDIAGNVMSQITWSFSTASAGFVDVTLPQTGLVDPMVIAFPMTAGCSSPRRADGSWSSTTSTTPPPPSWPTCASASTTSGIAA